MNMITLGSKVQDNVTGLKGIATSRVEYLNGCVRYAVQSKIKKDGEMPDSIYIDEEQLKVLVAKKVKSTPSGGSRPPPTRQTTPPR